ncbi:MAG: hypothetical protein CVV05_13135 [Gammaproteobacteria bacterium HGW-Gammaproteobacteria-1]|nr:MAG: hypothetical protein CVV05_13135 [Gammaproteobacteria bacterium HGW-Gammaproteobacteria-1]
MRMHAEMILVDEIAGCRVILTSYIAFSCDRFIFFPMQNPIGWISPPTKIANPTFLPLLDHMLRMTIAIKIRIICRI